MTRNDMRRACEDYFEERMKDPMFSMSVHTKFSINGLHDALFDFFCRGAEVAKDESRIEALTQAIKESR